jgi:hypothetical protein
MTCGRVATKGKRRASAYGNRGDWRAGAGTNEVVEIIDLFCKRGFLAWSSRIANPVHTQKVRTKNLNNFNRLKKRVVATIAKICHRPSGVFGNQITTLVGSSKVR